MTVYAVQLVYIKTTEMTVEGPFAFNDIFKYNNNFVVMTQLAFSIHNLVIVQIGAAPFHNDRIIFIKRKQ